MICTAIRVINTGVDKQKGINIMTNKELLIENIKNASAEHVKEHLLGLIKDLVDDCQITAGDSNGYIDNDDGIPILDFYVDNFMFTNFTK